MKKFLVLVLAGACVAGLVWVGCGGQTSPLTSGGGQVALSDAQDESGPGLDVRPTFRVPTKRRGVRLTVFVFRGEGDAEEAVEKPRPGRKETTCEDTNTNQAFVELPVRLAASGLPVEYQPAFEPRSVAGLTFDAVARGVNTWKTAVGDPDLFTFTQNPGGTSLPEQDGVNVIGWGRFRGPDNSFFAATWVWDDGQTILEADIFYNKRYKWAVNPAIEPGVTLCGEQLDVQAVGTHELGHMLGLGHVVGDGNSANGDERDATMYGSARKKELKKQTLTPGDEAGARTVAPPPAPAS